MYSFFFIILEKKNPRSLDEIQKKTTIYRQLDIYNMMRVNFIKWDFTILREVYIFIKTSRYDKKYKYKKRITFKT